MRLIRKTIFYLYNLTIVWNLFADFNTPVTLDDLIREVACICPLTLIPHYLAIGLFFSYCIVYCMFLVFILSMDFRVVILVLGFPYYCSLVLIPKQYNSPSWFLCSILCFTANYNDWSASREFQIIPSRMEHSICAWSATVRCSTPCTAAMVINMMKIEEQIYYVLRSNHTQCSLSVMQSIHILLCI